MGPCLRSDPRALGNRSDLNLRRDDTMIRVISARAMHRKVKTPL
jgi:predicted NodU family carbamoyl transferase